jgi:hypothetical protein
MMLACLGFIARLPVAAHAKFRRKLPNCYTRNAASTKGMVAALFHFGKQTVT